MKSVILKLAPFAVALGAGLSLAWTQPDVQSLSQLMQWLSQSLINIWEVGGVALIGLVPLSAWLLHLSFQQVYGLERDPRKVLLNCAFIGRNSTQIGLLGTVIALAMTGSKLTGDVSGNTTEAVMSIIPLVGQALVSTIVGIIISVLADVIIHFEEANFVDDEQERTVQS